MKLIEVTFFGWRNPIFSDALFFCLLYLFIISCDKPSFITDKVSDILALPSKYNEKLITIEGNVNESLIAFGMGYFTIDDGTGSITVIPSKTYPKVGERIKIKGKVKNAFVIGDKSLTVIVEWNGKLENK